MAKKRRIKRTAKRPVHHRFETTKRLDILLLVLVLSVLILAVLTMTKGAI